MYILISVPLSSMWGHYLVLSEPPPASRDYDVFAEHDVTHFVPPLLIFKWVYLFLFYFLASMKLGLNQCSAGDRKLPQFASG